MGDVLQLQQPLKDGGIRSVNFFNGRLLSGKDFTREQAARRQADWRLGNALGEGVVSGFGVELATAASTVSNPVLNITAGLAINRKGQTLCLDGDVQLAITRQLQANSVSCLFNDCSPIAGGTYVAGAGVYLLTIAPAESGEGSAATSGVDPSSVRCNTDVTVEAVQFRLLAVKPTLYADLDIGSTAFRNRLAYRAFGNAERMARFVDPFGAGAEPSGYGLVESLRQASVVSDLDVPLALIFITGSATIQFIDLWAVRRSLAESLPDALWQSVTSRRGLAEGEAMFLQFQEHIAALRTSTGALGPVTAQSHFGYLPAAGVIPVEAETDDTDAEATRFFAGLTYRPPVFINAARLESLIRHSLAYPPIDVTNGEALWLYRVRENMAQIASDSTNAPQSYIVFASGHLPYVGDAQFDLAYFNYSNYALAR